MSSEQTGEDDSVAEDEFNIFRGEWLNTADAGRPTGRAAIAVHVPLLLVPEPPLATTQSATVGGTVIGFLRCWTSYYAGPRLFVDPEGLSDEACQVWGLRNATGETRCDPEIHFTLCRPALVAEQKHEGVRRVILATHRGKPQDQNPGAQRPRRQRSRRPASAARHCADRSARPCLRRHAGARAQSRADLFELVLEELAN